MLKHTQTIHRQQPTNSLSVFDHFERLALKKVKILQLYCPASLLKIREEKEMERDGGEGDGQQRALVQQAPPPCDHPSTTMVYFLWLDTIHQF